MLMKTAILLMNLITLTALLRLWRSYAPTRGRAEKPLRLSRANRASTTQPSALTAGTTVGFSSITFILGEAEDGLSGSSIPIPTQPLPSSFGASVVGSPGRVPLPPRDEDVLP